MKLATIARPDGTPGLAVVDGESLHDLTGSLRRRGRDWNDIGSVLATGSDELAVVHEAAGEAVNSVPPLPATDTVLLPPVLAPRHVLCVAANYRAHVEETGTIEYAPETETCPWFFHKPQSSLNPHRSPIRLPAEYGRDVDWEAELAVVVGRRASRVSADKAFDYIAGYTVVNDVSARRMEVPERTRLRDRDRFHDWLHGKWFDSFCCVGPWMTTADELGDAAGLRIKLEVNGTRYQDGTTADMLFGIPELLAFLSRIVTLHPGDIIATGTPSGVGKAQGRFLQPGDVVAATVEGVGTLVNPVQADG